MSFYIVLNYQNTLFPKLVFGSIVNRRVVFTHSFMWCVSLGIFQFMFVVQCCVNLALPH